MYQDLFNIKKTYLAMMLFCLVIFFIPLQTRFTVYLGVFTLKLSQVFLFASVGIISLYIAQYRPSKTEKFLFVYILLILSCIFLSTFLAIDIKRSFILSIAIVILFISLVVPIILLNNKKAFMNSFFAFIASGTLFALYGLVQISRFYLGKEANVNFYPWDLIPRVPFFSSENVHANFSLTPCILLYVFYFYFEEIKKKFLILALFIINISAIFISNSRGAIISLSIAILMVTLFLFLFKKNYSRFNIISFAILAGSSITLIMIFSDYIFARLVDVSAGEGTIVDRLQIFSEAYRAFSGNIFFGIGLGNFPRIIGYTKDIHNIILMLLAETGIITTLLFLFLYLLLTITQILCIFSRHIDYDYRIFNITMLVSNFALLFHSLGEPALYNMNIFISIGISFALIKKAEVRDESGIY